MAVSAEIIRSLTRPHKVSSSFPMNARLPVIILRAMTFAAESVALREVDEVSIIKSQFITVPCIMAIETPSHRLGMMKLDVGVLFFQYPLPSIHFHRRMTVAAGKQPFCHRRRSDGEFFPRAVCKGRKTDPRQKYSKYDGLDSFLHF